MLRSEKLKLFGLDSVKMSTLVPDIALFAVGAMFVILLLLGIVRVCKANFYVGDVKLKTMIVLSLIFNIAVIMNQYISIYLCM